MGFHLEHRCFGHWTEVQGTRPNSCIVEQRQSELAPNMGVSSTQPLCASYKKFDVEV